MTNFIRDLDNPFSCYQEDNLAGEVSLKPILESQKRISGYLADIQPGA